MLPIFFVVTVHVWGYCSFLFRRAENGHRKSLPETRRAENGHRKSLPETRRAENGHRKSLPETRRAENGHRKSLPETRRAENGHRVYFYRKICRYSHDQYHCLAKRSLRLLLVKLPL